MQADTRRNDLPKSPKYATRWREAVHDSSKSLRGQLRRWAVSALAMTNRHIDARFLRCVYCHYVFDDQREEFARIIRLLKKMGTFVDTDACLAMLAGERPIDDRYFHLSFDDGFRNVFTNALPILKNEDVPALIFVPTGLVEGDWEDVERYCVAVAKYMAPIEMMTWDDIREAAASGFEIGSHTRSHTRFTEISRDPELLKYEIVGSKQDLEQQLGTPCDTISWPFGTRGDADERSLAAAKEAGYRACFGAFRGTIDPGATDPFQIPRHHFEAQWPVSHVKYFAQGNREET